MRPLAQIWLSPERVREYAIFNAATVDDLLRMPVRKRFRWHFFLLYLMIQTHLWIEMFERGHGHDLAHR
jgi:asparagine synthase (glutamine-hydrolysing)